MEDQEKKSKRRPRSMRVRMITEVTAFEWTLIEALSEPQKTRKLYAVPRSEESSQISG
ncbi:hypothetical protein [Microvenator marinus]|jgi:hypothetical protein|uniref:hypothetical protein n=1 Tax=Microvenator marinus TaxID=2600177 RepID=UPI00201B8DFA|nr:hypothetical protein [Microvenator marinus]